MEKKYITLSIPKDILRKVKILAKKQETSVSGLLSRVLEEIVSTEEGYRTARQRHLTVFAQENDLGTKGTIGWTREEFHDR